MVLLWIFIGIIALLIIITIAGYNTLVVKRNRTRNAWHQIDVQLRRRCDFKIFLDKLRKIVVL
ncbi:hypothetical protein KAX06_01550 [candidate division WOR-3 bacterium]|nr:hypothetical protein [candidate division WOR-3 bacterium]